MNKDLVYLTQDEKLKIDKSFLNRLGKEYSIEIEDLNDRLIGIYAEKCKKAKRGEEVKREAGFGFNMCLKMIDEITDIQWDKVRWRSDTNLNMASYFSATNNAVSQ